MLMEGMRGINHATPTPEERKREWEWRKYCYYFTISFSCLLCLPYLFLIITLVAGLQLTTNDNRVGVCTCRVQWFLAESSELLTEFIPNHLCVSPTGRIMFGLDPNIFCASGLENWEAELTVLPCYSWGVGKPLDCFLWEGIFKLMC